MFSEHPDGQPAPREVELCTAATLEEAAAVIGVGGGGVQTQPACAEGNDGNQAQATISLSQTMEQVKGEKNTLKAQRQHLIKYLRIAKRKHARLKKKTRQLSENDLVEALGLMRSRDGH